MIVCILTQKRWVDNKEYTRSLQVEWALVISLYHIKLALLGLKLMLLPTIISYQYLKHSKSMISFQLG